MRRGTCCLKDVERNVRFGLVAACFLCSAVQAQQLSSDWTGWPVLYYGVIVALVTWVIPKLQKRVPRREQPQTGMPPIDRILFGEYPIFSWVAACLVVILAADRGGLAWWHVPPLVLAVIDVGMWWLRPSERRSRRQRAVRVLRRRAPGSAPRRTRRARMPRAAAGGRVALLIVAVAVMLGFAQALTGCVGRIWE